MILRLRTTGLLLVFVLLAGHAHADSKTAKEQYERATAAYALGNYTEAAEAYEKAFQAKPDPALLYNAAQTHRIASNKARALLLYKSYLRIYGATATNRDEVRGHIAALERAIELDNAASSRPPTDTRPSTVVPTHEPVTPPVTAPIATTPPMPNDTSVVSPTSTESLTAQAPPPKKPVYKKGWFWGAVVGGVVVVGVAVGLGVGLTRAKSAPTPSLGAVEGN